MARSIVIHRDGVCGVPYGTQGKRPTLSRRWVRFGNMVACALLLAGCGGEGNGPVDATLPHEGTDASPASSAQRDAILTPHRSQTEMPPQSASVLHQATSGSFAIDGLTKDFQRQRLAAELEYADNPTANWQSEQFQERALRRLRELVAEAIEVPEAADAVDAVRDPQPTSATEAAPARIADLRPAAARIDAAPGAVVERWQMEGESRVVGSGSLGQLRAGLPAAVRPRVELKIVEVDLQDPQQPRTRVLVEWLAELPDARIGRNQVWDCVWNDASTDAPTLRELRLLDSETIHTRHDGLSFRPRVQELLGHNTSFAAQWERDLDAWRRQLDWRWGIDVVGPHGLAVGDVNGDGLEDLYLCEAGGLPNRLLIQQPDGSALDVSAQANVDFLEPTHSALLVDLDNDGDQDLALGVGRYWLWLANDGHGHFTQAGLHESNSMIRSMAAADYNQDGLLDIYVCGYFPRDASGDGVGLGRPLPYHDANNGVRNYLMENEGALRFRDVTDDVGLNQNNQRFSYACGWADYDNDGDPDLYVANDFGRNNLYRNDHGRFTDVAAPAGVEDISAGMSVSWGDFDRDGWLDLYVGNMYSSAGNRVSYQRDFLPGAAAEARQSFQRHARGNSLFRNRGDGRFEDVSLQAGVNMARWAWSSNFLDLNNDGWEDLLVANGMVTARQDPGDL